MIGWIKKLVGGSNDASAERTVAKTAPAMPILPDDGAVETTIAAGFKPDNVPKIAGVIAATQQARKDGARGFLHIFAGPDKGGNYYLGNKPVTIGRKADEAILVLRDGGVSGRHCEVRPVGGGFHIVDLGSKNGTYLNDKRVAGEKPLSNGDLICFGDTRIYVGVL